MKNLPFRMTLYLPEDFVSQEEPETLLQRPDTELLKQKPSPTAEESPPDLSKAACASETIRKGNCCLSSGKE